MGRLKNRGFGMERLLHSWKKTLGLGVLSYKSTAFFKKVLY
jgi:hypothetical protein